MSFPLYAKTFKIKNVYLPQNKNLPAIIHQEIVRVFFYSGKYRLIPSPPPKRLSENDFLFSYKKSHQNMIFEFNGKRNIFSYSKDIKELQKRTRQYSFQLINGKDEFKKISSYSWMKKNLELKKKKRKKIKNIKVVTVIPKEEIKKTNSKKIIKLNSKIAIAKKNDFKKTSIKEKSSFLELLTHASLLMGINQYFDNNNKYYKDETKRSLSIEMGFKMNNYQLSYEYRFLNLIKENQQVLNIKSNIFNARYTIKSMKFFKNEIKIQAKFGYGRYAYVDFLDHTESGSLYILGINSTIENLVRAGVQIESVPGSNFYQQVVTANIGIGWNY